MFILKKAVSKFFFPVPMVLILLLTGLLFLWSSKRTKTGKVLVTVGSLILLLLSTNYVAERIVAPLEAEYPPHSIQLTVSDHVTSDTQAIKYIVVLGSGHISNPALPLTGQIDSNALARLAEAVIIHRKLPESRLVLSGGPGFDPVPNAKIMADLAVELGIAEENIILEEGSHDTKDEALLIKPIVKDDRFMLVTSASHMPRAMALFRKQGMDPVPAPTAHLVKAPVHSRASSFFPSVSALYKSTRGVYEYMGITWAAIRGQL